MSSIDLVRLASGLHTIESIALIRRVTSTNDVARRIVTECIENDIPIPSAILVAREQLAGRGRNGRNWYSPPHKGIYATTIMGRPMAEIGLLPLAVGNMLALFLQETWGIPARIKWPNDIVVGARKIAGILIEAKTRDGEACLLIGTGLNVSPLGEDAPAHVISVAEAASHDHVDLEAATVAFIEHVDRALSAPLDRKTIVEQWRRLTIHRSGERVQCVLGDRTVSGTWGGIDEDGRALILQGDEMVAISAGDLVVVG